MLSLQEFVEGHLIDLKLSQNVLFNASHNSSHASEAVGDMVRLCLLPHIEQAQARLTAVLARGCLWRKV